MCIVRAYFIIDLVNPLSAMNQPSDHSDESESESDSNEYLTDVSESKGESDNASEHVEKAPDASEDGNVGSFLVGKMTHFREASSSRISILSPKKDSTAKRMSFQSHQLIRKRRGSLSVSRTFSASVKPVSTAFRMDSESKILEERMADPHETERSEAHFARRPVSPLSRSESLARIAERKKSISDVRLFGWSAARKYRNRKLDTKVKTDAESLAIAYASSDLYKVILITIFCRYRNS